MAHDERVLPSRGRIEGKHLVGNPPKTSVAADLSSSCRLSSGNRAMPYKTSATVTPDVYSSLACGLALHSMGGSPWTMVREGQAGAAGDQPPYSHASGNDGAELSLSGPGRTGVSTIIGTWRLVLA